MLEATRVDVGNPHLVLALGRRRAARHATTLVALGARIDGATPGGANVEVMLPGADARRARHGRVRAGRRAHPGVRHRRLRGRRGRPRVGALRRRPPPSTCRAVPWRSPSATRCCSPATSPRSPSSTRRGREERDAPHVADRAGLPGEDRPGRRHPPARTPPRTPRPASTSSRSSSTPPAPTRSARLVQRRAAPDPPTYIGKGKAEELREIALETDCDTVVFDDELTPAQQRNLEKLLGRTAIDRTAVILDIFAQNAHSQEGKAQVELALLALPAAPPPRQGHGPVAAGRRHVRRRRPDRHPRPGRDAARGRPPAHPAPHPQARGRAARDRQAPRHAAQGAAPRPHAARRHRRLHERRQVHAAQPAHRRRACSSRTASSPPSTPPPAASTCPAARRCCSPTPSASSASCPTSSSRRSSPRCRSRPTPTCSCTSSTRRRSTPRATSTPCARCCARSAPTRCPSSRLQQGRPGPERGARAWPRSTRARSPSAPPPARASRSCCSPIADRLRALTNVVELAVPYDRGDVLAAVHREGEVLSEQADDDGMRLRVRLDDASLGQFVEYVVA